MSKICVSRVELKNFFSYGNSWHTVDLHEGLNVVLGYDKDKDRSNGSGKTSFLEAVPFALFGATGKGSSLNKIVNWANGKQCEVRLHFEKDGIQYELQRGIKPGIVELIKDGVKIPKLSDKRMFQQELETDLIGMDFRAAQAIHFQNANNMISMFNTPKADKRKFIEKFFNLEIYSAMNEHVNSKLRDLELKRSELDSEKTFKERRISELDMEISGCVMPDIASYEERVERSQSAIKGYKEDHADFLIDVTDIQKELDKERKELEILEKELQTLTGELKEMELTREGQKQRINGYSERLFEIGDLTEQKEKLAKLKTGLAGIGDIEEEARESRKKIADIQTRLHTIQACNTNVKEKIRVAIANVKEWENKGVLDTAECPTCFQEADAEHIKGHIKEQVNKYLLEKAELEAELSEGEVRASEIEVELEAEKEVLTKAESRNSTKVTVEKKIAELSNIEEKEAEVQKIKESLIDSEGIIEQLAGHINTHLSSIGTLDGTLQGAKDGIKQKEKIITNANKATHELENLEVKFENDRDMLQSQKDIAKRIEDEQAARVASRDQMKAELTEWDKKYKKIDTMKDYYTYTKETLKDENVKQYAISNIVPYVQQRTNHYLSETGHNYYIELDAWLDGTIKGFGVGENDFTNMSGGEGKSIDLALKFAMMDVARRQAGSYLDILVLDELLDSSIDSFGLEKTVDIVKLKQKEDNLKVFVVSHREEIGMFEFDRAYNVEKENGFSSITVS